MRGKKMKRLLSLAMAVTVFLSMGTVVLAGTINDASEKTDYHVTSSTGNIGSQDYVVATDTIKSYLRLCDDGSLMKFEAPNYYSYKYEFDKYDLRYLVEYYDKSYNRLSSKRIEEELPLFGGFYASKNFYYLITWQ